MSKARMSWLLIMTIVGSTLMYVGFGSHRVSYLSIIEVAQGKRLITNLFAPRVEEPVKRLHYNLLDNTIYYTKSRYNQSLQDLSRVIFATQSKDKLSQMLYSLPPLKNKENKSRKYANEEEAIADYLKGYPYRSLTTHFNLLERAVFSIVSNLERNSLIKLLQSTEIPINVTKKKLQAELVIFVFSSDDKLVRIGSR